MKHIIAFIVIIGASLVLLPSAFADGCFICSGGGYVKYIGSDTFETRKKAEAQFGCQVTGTTSSCNGAKGTVSWLEKTSPQPVATR